ncbi:MAG: HAMP domain-containing sensor histidine kinase [Bdellovibrionota bacterium]
MESSNNEVTGLLGTVRKKTDTSLANERTKTDISLNREQNAAEMSADSLVSENRVHADQAQNDKRRLFDAKKEEARSSPDAQDLTSEREIADSSLEQERLVSDLAQKRERATSDAAVTKERRRLKLAAEALFVLERGATDADLLGERTIIDGEIELVATDLTNEVDAHNETKALMTVVSRDLKDPLDMIAKLGESLHASLVSEKIVSPEIHRLLGLIRRNSSSMERLVTDLLDLERLSTGNFPLNRTDEDVADVLMECTDIFGSIAMTKNIEITTNCSEQPLMGTFDRDRILQVLSNLIQNALRHTPNKGSIAITAVRRGSQVEISVVDSGKEIPTKKQVGIVDKFSQLHKLGRQGSGLGLHLCKGIVEAHGGNISIESELGTGNTYCFTLPIN